MCPISYELPVDPVLAEDGNIYERECIKRHLAKKQTSPINNTPMGTRLIEPGISATCSRAWPTRASRTSC